MFRKFYCTAAAVLISTILIAQQTKVIQLIPGIMDLAGREFYIDSVVDNRIARENIGTARVGMNNKSVPAVFEKSFEETMNFYFAVTVPKSANQVRLIAVINELHVYEKIYAMKERGVADVNISFCKLDSGKLRVVAEASNSQESGGMDVSNAHDQRIDLAIRECIKQLQASNWKENPGTPLDAGGPWVPIDDEHNILKAKTWNYGTYKNFNDLRSNSPDHSDPMIVPEAEMGELVMIKNKATKKKLVEAYGFNDGTNLYINTFFYNGMKSKGAFAKVESVGAYLAWIDYYQSDVSHAVSSQFGLIGALAAGTGDPDIIVLDMKSGMIIPLRPQVLSKILEPEPKLLAEYEKSKVRDPRVQLEFIKRFNELHPDL